MNALFDQFAFAAQEGVARHHVYNGLVLTLLFARVPLGFELGQQLQNVGDADFIMVDQLEFKAQLVEDGDD